MNKVEEIDNKIMTLKKRLRDENENVFTNRFISLQKNEKAVPPQNGNNKDASTKKSAPNSR